jgi:hypothetical protein
MSLRESRLPVEPRADRLSPALAPEAAMSDPLMSRPVMDPLFLRELQAPPTRRRLWAQAAARAVRWLTAKLLSHPLAWRGSRLAFRGADDPWHWRFVRGAAYRMLFVPIILALAASALVFRGTHPQAVLAAGDPGSFGVYYDPVQLASEQDGTPLAGWLVPVVDARRVLLHRDRLLHHKHPAVVLVHDHGQSPQQMLPLIAPLHEDGLVVLAIGLRGQGAGSTRASTFGLNEAGDVQAAVNLLRRTAFVDETRIAVVGIGTGANAALLAAGRDPQISALVLADAVPSAGHVVADQFGPNMTGLRWMQPLAKWAFEITYRQDMDELGLDQNQSTLTGRKVLHLKDVTTNGRLTADPTEQIRTFCRETLRPWDRK